MPLTPGGPIFFRKGFLDRLERLSFASKRTFRGQVKGERKSNRKGVSVEFLDHRHYGIGDDLRHVDWNIFGRLNHLYVKLFLDEEDLSTHIFLDASASMECGSPSKLEYAKRLAGALVFVALRNLESPTLRVLRDGLAEQWSPGRGRDQWMLTLDFLAGLRAGGLTKLDRSLSDYARLRGEPGLAILISDLLDPQGYRAGLQALRHRNFEIHVLHLLSPEEIKPPLGNDVRLVDAETGQAREVTVDREVARNYQNRLRTFLDSARRFCRANSIHYLGITTDAPLENVVLRQLRGTLLT